MFRQILIEKDTVSLRKTLKKKIKLLIREFTIIKVLFFGNLEVNPF